MRTYDLGPGERGECHECNKKATRYVCWEPWEDSGPCGVSFKDSEIPFIMDGGAMVMGLGFCDDHGPKQEAVEA